MSYKVVLFDADETLFSFDIFAGLTALFHQYEVTFTREDFVHYQTKNKALWLEYQNGKIDAQYLQITRFQEWGNKLGVEPNILNEGFLDAMATICEPLPGATQLLHALKGKCRLVIVTNGFNRLQNRRIKESGLEHIFDFIVVSELVGAPKPSVKIFEHTFELLGHPPKNQILMVGDTLSSDILGGHNAGIDTCWLQHQGVTNDTNIKPTFQITHLNQLHSIIGV